jgi:uncharacterized protein
MEHGSTIPFGGDLEIKVMRESDECFIVSGYASVFGNLDRTGDIMMPGAFTKSLKDRGADQICFLWNHDTKEAPIGALVDLHENKRGLWFKAEMPKDDTFVSGRVMPQLRRKGLKGVSIGYQAREKERRSSDGARLLKRVDLFEISLTSMPANPLAEIETVSKSFTPATHNDVERTLDEVARELWNLARRDRRG